MINMERTDKIKVKHNPNGDTRFAPKDVTFEQFEEANESHISDVKRLMYRISDMVSTAGDHHDFTKRTLKHKFFDDFKSTLEHGTNFVDGEWYKLHVVNERHHLDNHVPTDVNLIDVIEMLADGVCAGMARSGEVRDMSIAPEILEKAVQNTIQMMKSMIEVVDD